MLVAVAALGGCLAPPQGGSVVASPMDWTPDDAVDRSAVHDDRIAAAVDRACSSDDDAHVEFAGSERSSVRSSYGDLRPDDGFPTVRCGDGDGAVRVELRLLT